MRLPASQARAITRHAATTIRVRVDPQLIPPLRPATRHSGRPFLPQPGETYPVHGGHYTLGTNPRTGKPRWEWTTTSPVHVLVKSRHMGELGHLTPEQAQAEGYSSVEEFEIAWVDHHEHAWIEKQVQTLRDAGDDDPEATRDWWARHRYANRWATSQVWVLKVQAVHDLPRLLPDEHGTVRVHDTPDERARVGDEGYTHTASAAMDDLDAIPVGVLDTRWSQAAQVRHRKAIATAATEEEKRRDARRLARQVRQLAIDEDPKAEQIRQLLNPENETQEAA